MVVEQNKTRVCSKCKTEYPATKEFFYRDSSKKSGFDSHCKKCASEHDKQYRKDNPDKEKQRQKKYSSNNSEKIKQRKKQYRLDNADKIKQYRLDNIDRDREWRKQYYKDNVEKIKEYYKKYCKDNAEKQKECSKRWNKEHPAAMRIINQRRNSQKRSLPATFTVKQWNDCKQAFDNKCAYCGKEKILTQDHFVPLSKDGEYTINNIVPCCKSCNSSKGGKYFSEWYPTYKFYSKKRERKVLKYLAIYEKVQQLKIV